MKLKLPTAMGITLVAYVFGFFGLQLFAGEKTFSELENRNLQTKPELTTQSFLGGTFATAFETYIADQFPLRNNFISLKSYSELALQKKENNGVYIAEDGYFLQNFEAPDMNLAEKNATYINEFANEFNVTVMLAPTATKVLEDKLPAFALPYDEGVYISDFKNLLSEKVIFPDLLTTLKAHDTEEIYYKTDHHWTSLGAYYAYTAYCEAVGLTPQTLEDFNIKQVTNSFYGSLFSKGNFTFAKPDSIEIFEPKISNDLTVTYEGSNETTTTLYDETHLETKDKYSLFLNGNHPIIKIETGVKNGKKLMIIKDSYANSFVPFLTAHYEEIHILDLRLVNMPLATYARENGLSDVLFLYNVQNFSVEAKLSLLRK